jgi:hypothetical protein
MTEGAGEMREGGGGRASEIEGMMRFLIKKFSVKTAKLLIGFVGIVLAEAIVERAKTRTRPREEDDDDLMKFHVSR